MTDEVKNRFVGDHDSLGIAGGAGGKYAVKRILPRQLSANGRKLLVRAFMAFVRILVELLQVQNLPCIAGRRELLSPCLVHDDDPGLEDLQDLADPLRRLLGIDAHIESARIGNAVHAGQGRRALLCQDCHRLLYADLIAQNTRDPLCLPNKFCISKAYRSVIDGGTVSKFLFC